MKKDELLKRPKKVKWQELSNPDDIMKKIQFDINTDKVQVIKHFGRESKDIQIFKDLLSSGYYDAQDFFDIPAGRLCKEAQIELIKYLDKAWQNSNDVSLILLTRVSIIDKDEDVAKKLNYFYKNNKTIYDKLDKILLSLKQRGYSPNRILNFLINDKEVDREVIINFAMKFPKSLEREVYKPEYREIYDEIAKRSKAPKWKTANRTGLIMEEVTEENKWEILEYFAEHDPIKFQHIINYHSFDNETTKVGFTKKEIFERYKDVDLTTLPQALSEYVKKLIDQEKDKKEQKELKKANSRWYDDNGELLEFFKLGNIKIKSKEDYFKVVDKYLAQDLSIVKFCRKYKLSDESGFRKLLKAVASENEELAAKILEKTEFKKAQYLSGGIELIKEVCEGRKSISELIKLSDSYNFESLINLATQLYPTGEKAEILAVKVINYYHERLNEYKPGFEVENINKMLTNNEIMFIAGFDDYNNLLMGDYVELEKLFTNNINFLNSSKRALIQKKVASHTKGSICSLLTKYNSIFNKKANTTGNYSVKKGDAYVKVTPEVVDRAYQYAKANNLFPSETTMAMIIRSIVNDRIDNAEITLKEKESMINQAKQLIMNIVDIDEYFKVVDSLPKKRV